MVGRGGFRNAVQNELEQGLQLEALTEGSAHIAENAFDASPGLLELDNLRTERASLKLSRLRLSKRSFQPTKPKTIRGTGTRRRNAKSIFLRRVPRCLWPLLVVAARIRATRTGHVPHPPYREAHIPLGSTKTYAVSYTLYDGVRIRGHEVRSPPTRQMEESHFPMSKRDEPTLHPVAEHVWETSVAGNSEYEHPVCEG